MNYYNEFDPKAAAWLRELIAQGLIPAGHVDERSICDVSATELSGFTQCHFFAGIGGWSLALQLAGWPSDRPVWTGSCPCQPFSSAGKGLGQEDPRHLWPDLFRLARECRPDVLFGEQVAKAVGHRWLDGVSADLEAEGYAVGSIVLGAHSVGAPHIRQRLYWVADHSGERRNGRADLTQSTGRSEPEAGCTAGRVDHASDPRCAGEGIGGAAWSPWNEARLLESQRSGASRGLVHSEREGLEGYSGDGHDRDKPGRLDPHAAGPAAAAGSPWNYFDLLPCTDGKARRIEPGTFPLAHGISGRVGLLRGYGNAIVPQVAAEFIQAFLEVA